MQFYPVNGIATLSISEYQRNMRIKQCLSELVKYDERERALDNQLAGYESVLSDYGVIMAALVLTVAPILVLYLFLQKEIIDGVVAGAVKS